jgi:hypothetical protein
MQIDIDKMRNEFFKKSLSVGHHNIRYAWMQIMLMILNCIKNLESFEEGANSPSPQTLRDRLNLDGSWLEFFHESVWEIAQCAVKRFPRFRWFISIDETYVPFFGHRGKLNAKLIQAGLGKYVHGYRAKTPGATGSFCFLVISLCCCKIRIPIAVKMIRVGDRYSSWLKPWLLKVAALKKDVVILADRGFGKSTWFYHLMDEIKAKYVVRIPLRKKENKNKVKNGVDKFQYWMKDSSTNEKTLLICYVAKDSQDRKYILASNIEEKSNKLLLEFYLNRWDIENIFKDSDRIMLPTSSTNPRMRLFTVILSFFLFAIWQISPFIIKIRYSLRKTIKCIISALCTLINVRITPLGNILENEQCLD